MKVKVKCEAVKGKKIIVNVKSGERREEPEEVFTIPVKDLKYKIIKGSPYEKEWVIEINDIDLDKIKDRVIEILE